MTAAQLYKKMAAALLLLVMLLTTFVQVTHSHNSKTAVTAAIKKNAGINTACAAAGTDVNCFLCDYQLAKDADLSVTINSLSAPEFKRNKPAVFNHSFITNFTPAAGNRGPPAAF